MSHKIDEHFFQYFYHIPTHYFNHIFVRRRLNSYIDFGLCVRAEHMELETPKLPEACESSWSNGLRCVICVVDNLPVERYGREPLDSSQSH